MKPNEEQEEHRAKMLGRLRRVEGQLRGIQGMIASGAECEAVAQQLAAARKALDRAFFEMIACSMEMELQGAKSAASLKKATAQMTQLLAKYA